MMEARRDVDLCHKSTSRGRSRDDAVHDGAAALHGLDAREVHQQQHLQAHVKPGGKGTQVRDAACPISTG